MSTISSPSDLPGDGKPAFRRRLMRWGARLGFWGFVFFTVKGIVWLAIFAFGARYVV